VAGEGGGESYPSIRRRPTDSFRREIISRVQNSDGIKKRFLLKVNTSTGNACAGCLGHFRVAFLCSVIADNVA
jgi:hypothetical protein